MNNKMIWISCILFMLVLGNVYADEKLVSDDVEVVFQDGVDAYVTFRLYEIDNTNYQWKASWLNDEPVPIGVWNTLSDTDDKAILSLTEESDSTPKNFGNYADAIKSLTDLVSLPDNKAAVTQIGDIDMKYGFDFTSFSNDYEMDTTGSEQSKFELAVTSMIEKYDPQDLIGYVDVSEFEEGESFLYYGGGYRIISDGKPVIKDFSLAVEDSTPVTDQQPNDAESTPSSTEPEIPSPVTEESTETLYYASLTAESPVNVEDIKDGQIVYDSNKEEYIKEQGKVVLYEASDYAVSVEVIKQSLPSAFQEATDELEKIKTEIDDLSDAQNIDFDFSYDAQDKKLTLISDTPITQSTRDKIETDFTEKLSLNVEFNTIPALEAEAPTEEPTTPNDDDVISEPAVESEPDSTVGDVATFEQDTSELSKTFTISSLETDLGVIKTKAIRDESGKLIGYINIVSLDNNVYNENSEVIGTYEGSIFTPSLGPVPEFGTETEPEAAESTSPDAETEEPAEGTPESEPDYPVGGVETGKETAEDMLTLYTDEVAPLSRSQIVEKMETDIAFKFTITTLLDDPVYGDLIREKLSDLDLYTLDDTFIKSNIAIDNLEDGLKKNNVKIVTASSDGKTLQTSYNGKAYNLVSLDENKEIKLNDEQYNNYVNALQSDLNANTNELAQAKSKLISAQTRDDYTQMASLEAQIKDLNAKQAVLYNQIEETNRFTNTLVEQTDSNKLSNLNSNLKQTYLDSMARVANDYTSTLLSYVSTLDEVPTTEDLQKAGFQKADANEVIRLYNLMDGVSKENIDKAIVSSKINSAFYSRNYITVIETFENVDNKETISTADKQVYANSLITAFDPNAAEKLEALKLPADDPNAAKFNAILDKNIEQSHTLYYKVQPYANAIAPAKGAASLLKSLFKLEFNPFSEFLDSKFMKIITGDWADLACAKHIKAAQSQGSQMTDSGRVVAHIEGTKQPNYAVIFCNTDDDCVEGTCAVSELGSFMQQKICMDNDLPVYNMTYTYMITYYATPGDQSKYTISTNYDGTSYTLLEDDYRKTIVSVKGKPMQFELPDQINQICLTATGIHVCNSVALIENLPPTKGSKTVALGTTGAGGEANDMTALIEAMLAKQ